MQIKFSGKKISAVITVLPKQESCFDDELENYNLSAGKASKMKEIIGINKHRLALPEMTGSDLAITGFKKLFADGVITPDQIDVLIYVTQTPDYLIPPTSSFLHRQLGLRNDVLCVDINQGCAGFVLGLEQAFFYLDNPAINTVAVVTADVLSHKINKNDCHSFPLAGDAAGITIVERTEYSIPIYAINYVYSEKAEAIMIPAGGARLSSSQKTSIETIGSDGNIRSANNLRMDGLAVYNFVCGKACAMIKELLNFAGIDKDEIDSFVFHQPNKFLLHEMANILEIPFEKMPHNIVENFGNSSSATIPVNLCFNLKERLCTQNMRLFFGGFGVGLTTAGIIMDTEKLSYCELIEMEN